jgi:hypothetical protein
MMRGGVRLDIGPRYPEERTQDLVAQRRNPCQAAWSRPAKEVQEHGLGLVIHGVSEDNAGGPHPRRDSVQAGIPRRPSPRLYRFPAATLRRIHSAHAGPEVSPRRLSHDECRIPVGRLPSQAMMHVSHEQANVKTILKAE